MDFPSSCQPYSQCRSEFNMRSDEELARNVQHSSEAFAELYRRNLKAVYSYQLARVGNVHDAQDLTTQTFLAAQEAISSFREQGKFAAWLMAIARRKTADYFRCKRPILPLEEAGQVVDCSITPEEFANQQLSLEQVAQALKRLSPERAEAIALQIFAGLSIAETAQVMGKSEAAVKMLVCRALKDLRKYLATTDE
jgi:RNA polymerase sigma-70 factor, ECF subfamily